MNTYKQELRRELLAWLDSLPDGGTTDEAAAKFTMHPKNVYRALTAMKRDGLIANVGTRREFVWVALKFEAALAERLELKRTQRAKLLRMRREANEIRVRRGLTSIVQRTVTTWEKPLKRPCINSIFDTEVFYGK